MLFKTLQTFYKVVDYRKGGNGSWTAEFHRSLEIEAFGPSLEDCRRHATDALDESSRRGRLAEQIPPARPTRNIALCGDSNTSR